MSEQLRRLAMVLEQADLVLRLHDKLHELRFEDAGRIEEEYWTTEIGCVAHAASVL